MTWTPKNKAEQLFKNLFETKSNMAKELNLSRVTLDTYLSDANLMNSQIKKIAKLKQISELKLFKAINN
jgi:endonuclease III|tara:strand:+ start:3292 stop:3498 length:207 start_codon:yes stop_codon:yes gene_type:complete